MRALIIVSIILTALALGAGLAHLYALPNKIGMARDSYLVAQQIYRGWALLGLVIAAALVTTSVLTVRARGSSPVFQLGLAAALCIALSLVVFFLFTYPANRATVNWTQLPADWESLRRQWEYSHAVNAVLYLVALVLLATAAVNWRGRA